MCMPTVIVNTLVQYMIVFTVAFSIVQCNNCYICTYLYMYL